MRLVASIEAGGPEISIVLGKVGFIGSSSRTVMIGVVGISMSIQRTAKSRPLDAVVTRRFG